MLRLDFATYLFKQQNLEWAFCNVTLQHLQCPHDGSVAPSKSHIWHESLKSVCKWTEICLILTIMLVLNL